MITSGKVYKGKMSNNQNIAIKHIINDGNMETFVREVTSLSHVRHLNHVSLLGCWVERDEGMNVSLSMNCVPMGASQSDYLVI